MRTLNILAALLALESLPASAEILYATDFDTFPTGENTWAGFDGWLSNDTTSGVQAIDDGLFGGALGKTAALGFNRPGSPFTTVLRSINYNPAEGGTPLIEFQALFGIEDSTQLTNFRRDDFFFSFYNMGGDLLASLRISNTDSEYGFWWRGGSLQAGATESDTGQDFIQGELYNLSIVINLEANRWSAALDGLALFEDVRFNTTGLPRTLGPIAAEWQIAAGTAAGYGDNWMLVADLRVETLELESTPLEIESIARDPIGGVRLRWQALPGFTYAVEYSQNLQTWFSDLPNSILPAPPSAQILEYTDQGAASLLSRYYRLRRTPIPVAP